MKKINKFCLFSLGFLASLGLYNTILPQEVKATNITIDVMLNGKKLVFDQDPMVIDGVTYIPLRNVAETTGSVVKWSNQTRIVSLQDAERKIEFEIGASKGLLNGVEIKMPNSFVVPKSMRTMVPLRFVSENMGIGVFWDKGTNSVKLSSSKLDSDLKNKDVIYVDDAETIEKVEENMIKVANQLQANAEKYIGTPYLYGANPNSVLYFDCSSFTQRLFAESGINLPRVSSAQYEYGEKLNYNQLEAGDLVFFDTAGKGTITHVAIYINENKLLHATVSKGVDYTSFSSYWKERYFSAARVK